jgi:hypothetical protein
MMAILTGVRWNLSVVLIRNFKRMLLRKNKIIVGKRYEIQDEMMNKEICKSVNLNIQSLYKIMIINTNL